MRASKIQASTNNFQYLKKLQRGEEEEDVEKRSLGIWREFKWGMKRDYFDKF